MIALAQKKSIHPVAEERRRFQRVKIHLLGRYMLPDRREFPCQVVNMCLSERRIGDADLTFRFPRKWLERWQDVASAIERLTTQLHGPHT